MRNQQFVVLALLLTAVVFAAQLFLLKPGLDNEVLNRFAPSSSDAVDCAKRARVLAEEGFTAAFADGRRMPGYPLILRWLAGGFAQPYLVARFIQVFFSSLIVAIAFLTLCIQLKSQVWALLGALLFAAWLPFYYFSPVLSAESLSLFFVALFCYLVARYDETQSRLNLLSMIILAVLVYLDSARALLFLPFAAVLEHKRGGGGRGVTITGPLTVLVVLMLPWTIWVSTKNGTFIPLTTASGYHMYVGTGVTTPEDATPVDLPTGSAATLKLGKPGLRRIVDQEVENMTAAQQNGYYRKTAMKLWIDRPKDSLSYGAAKVLHAFGFSFRDARDALLAAQFIAATLMSLFLWRRRRHREWCVFLWVVTLVAVFQAFVFLPDQRLKTVVYDFPALLVLFIGVAELLRRTQPRQT